MALIKKIKTKGITEEHLIVDGAGSVLPLSRVTGEAVTVNQASVASAEGVVWLNNNDPKQFAAVSGGQYYKDWSEFTYEGITYPPSSIYADKKAKALFRVGNSLMQCNTDDVFEYILADDLNQVTEEAHAYTDQKVAALVNGAPDKLDTLDELAAALKDNENIVDTLNEAIGNKVSKVEGKGLSTNDYTTAEKNKVAGIEVNFDSTKVPYNVVLPFSGSLALAVTVSESSAISPNGIFWSAANNKFVARTGVESSYTYHATWPACTIGEESYPASAYYNRADIKGKMYLKGDVSYGFVAGSLVPVGKDIDLSNYYTKTDVDENFIKKNGQYVNIGNYVAIGDINADSEDDAVEIGTKVSILGAVSIGKGVDIGNGVRVNLADYGDLRSVAINRAAVGDYYGVHIGNYQTKGFIMIGTELSSGFINTANHTAPALVFGKNVSLGNSVTIDQNVYIGSGARLDSEILVSYSNNEFDLKKNIDGSVSAHVTIGNGSHIGKGVSIADSAVIRGAVIGDAVSIGDNFKVETGAQKLELVAGSEFLHIYHGKPQTYRIHLNNETHITSPIEISLTHDEHNISYLTIKDPNNGNAVGKIAFSNGDVISTSVVSGDTLTV